MNEIKIKHVHDYFEEKIAACRADIVALYADHRGDEAAFVKVKMNVYDIFATVFSAALKNSGDDVQLCQFFLARLSQIPQNWHTSLANAEAHGEVEKAHIEHIKLDTADEIQRTFTSIWEE